MNPVTVTGFLHLSGRKDLAAQLSQERLDLLGVLANLRKERDRAHEILREVLAYFDNHADVDDGSDGTPRPNAIMSMETEFTDRIKALLGGAMSATELASIVQSIALAWIAAQPTDPHVGKLNGKRHVFHVRRPAGPVSHEWLERTYPDAVATWGLKALAAAVEAQMEDEAFRGL